MADANWRKAKRRAHGLGCMFRRGKTFYGRLVIGGRVIVRSLGTGDERKAKAAFVEFLRPYELGNREKALAGLQVRLGGVREEIKAFNDAKPALALADGFTAYRASRERPDTGADTLAMYESQWRRLVSWTAENAPDAKEMRQFNRALAERFADALAAEMSPNTFNKYMTLFRRVWDVLGELARTDENPWAKIRPRTVRTFTRRELTIDELHRVCGGLSGEMRTLFAVGIYTGLRLGDCALLEWGAVDLARGFVSVIPRKTARHANGKPVIIPIHATLAAMLNETPRTARVGYLMPETAALYQRDKAALTDRIQRTFERCGIRTTSKAGTDARARVEVGFHSLRHTFVSMAANAGVPLALIQSIVGHSNPVMTRHYFHESEAALKNAVAALPDVGATQTPPDGSKPVAARLDGLAAMLDGMTRAELEAARDEIARRLDSLPTA